MADKTLSIAVWATLEAAINKALRYDPGTCIALGKLSGQVLAVESTAPAFTVYLAPHDQGVWVWSHYEGDVNTRLRGPLPALLTLTATDTTSLADSGVEVLGNTGLLGSLQRIFNNLDIDWEEPVSQCLGDVLGHSTAELLRSTLGWCTARTDTAIRLTGEYLTEELGALPSKAQLQRFYSDVDQLRSATDRLAAHLNQIKQQLASTVNTTINTEADLKDTPEC